jgi:hypothetical protein
MIAVGHLYPDGAQPHLRASSEIIAHLTHFGEANLPRAQLDFARQATAGPSHRLALVPCDAGSMLMHSDNRDVDHLDSGIVSDGKCVYDAAPDTSPPPADETVIASGIRAERLRQIAPWRSDLKT